MCWRDSYSSGISFDRMIRQAVIDDNERKKREISSLRRHYIEDFFRRSDRSIRGIVSGLERKYKDISKLPEDSEDRIKYEVGVGMINLNAVLPF